MKVIGSTRNWRPKKRGLDPEEIASAIRIANREDYIDELKARRAELERTIERLGAITGKGKGSEDWLLYLPRTALPSHVMWRACDYLEKMRTRLEAEGTKLWLNKNHDPRTRVFEVSKFRTVNGAIFCSGVWTAVGHAYRSLYKGVSPDVNVWMCAPPDAVFDHLVIPENCMSKDDHPTEVKAAYSAPGIRGLVGACCLGIYPAYGVSPIYRFDRKRMIELHNQVTP